MAFAGSPAGAADDSSHTFCAELDRFRAAQFDGTEQPAGRRWVEMHWLGTWLDFDNGFGLKCDSSRDGASLRFCGWLETNTSIEFPTRLPTSILKCAGYRVRTPLHWGNWTRDFSPHEGKRRMLLEVHLVSSKYETGALRLSSFAAGKNATIVPMPAVTERIASSNE
jgi:hypothetical protein